MKAREPKYPFATAFGFTKAAVLEAAEQVKALGLEQVEFSCAVHRGMRAVIYGSGRIVLYSRFSYRNRPQRIKLGELGLITLDQARAAHRVHRLKASQGVDPRTPTLSSMSYRQLHEEHYVVQRQARQKKTLHTDLSRHANWLGPEFNAVRIVDISKTDVSRFVLRMQEAGLAPATIRTTVGQLKATLDIAVELGIVPRNVAKGVGLPRVNNRRTEFITVPQMQAFMAAARVSHQRVGACLLMLLALTGARLGEGLGAKWVDVDLDAGLWRLPTQKSGKPGVIHLSDAAKAVIRELIPVRRNEWIFPGMRDNDHLARPIRLFRKLCRQAEIPDGFRIHDSRHGWISAGIYAGIPLEIMSQGARHASPVTTRIYSHAHKESLMAAQETIAGLFMPESAAAAVE